MMEDAVKLTKRESEIAELFAWGASKKDIANRLFISERTVENHARNIYDKTGCTKVNELSAWWFCMTFHISFELSPLKRKVVALFLLGVLVPQIWSNDNVIMARNTRTTTVRTCRIRGRRKADGNFFPFEF